MDPAYGVFYLQEGWNGNYKNHCRGGGWGQTRKQGSKNWRGGSQDSPSGLRSVTAEITFQGPSPPRHHLLLSPLSHSPVNTGWIKTTFWLYRLQMRCNSYASDLPKSLHSPITLGLAVWKWSTGKDHAKLNGSQRCQFWASCADFSRATDLQGEHGKKPEKGTM